MADNFYTTTTIEAVRGSVETHFGNILKELLPNVEDETYINFLSAVFAGWALENVEIKKVGAELYTYTLPGGAASADLNMGQLIDAVLEIVLPDHYQLVRSFSGVAGNWFSPDYKSDFRLVDSEGNDIGGLASTDSLNPANYLTKIDSLLTYALEESWPLDSHYKIEIRNGEDQFQTAYTVINSEMLTEALGVTFDDFKDWSDGTISNDDIDIETTSLAFLVLESNSAQKIVLKYTVNGVDEFRAVSWSQIDLSGTEHSASHRVFLDRNTGSSENDLIYGAGIQFTLPVDSVGQELGNAIIVQQSDIDEESEGVDISLTGHSLGGGLAGYIGAIYDQDALVFNY